MRSVPAFKHCGPEPTCIIFQHKLPLPNQTMCCYSKCAYISLCLIRLSGADCYSKCKRAKCAGRGRNAGV